MCRKLAKRRTVQQRGHNTPLIRFSDAVTISAQAVLPFALGYGHAALTFDQVQNLIGLQCHWFNPHYYTL